MVYKQNFGPHGVLGTRAFVNTTGEILKANFKCATAKLNQIIFCKCKL